MYSSPIEEKFTEELNFEEVLMIWENIVLILFNNHIIICLRVIVKKCFMLVWKHASKMAYIYNANSYI